MQMSHDSVKHTHDYVKNDRADFYRFGPPVSRGHLLPSRMRPARRSSHGTLAEPARLEDLPNVMLVDLMRYASIRY